MRIVHESWGAGPALVCCHAFAVDRKMWEPQILRFSQTHRLVTFDQRGSGESDHPVPVAGEADPYNIDAFADDLRGVLDDLGIPRARILGLSMGGATALRFAARWPERVEGLVLASTMASRLPEAFIERAKVVERVLPRWLSGCSSAAGCRRRFDSTSTGRSSEGFPGKNVSKPRLRPGLRPRRDRASWAATVSPSIVPR
jgi:pimeloyl-ACP methyl ester carboxylesterase